MVELDNPTGKDEVDTQSLIPFQNLSHAEQRRTLLKGLFIGAAAVSLLPLAGTAEASEANPTVEEENTIQPPLVFSVGRYSTLPRDSTHPLPEGGDSLPVVPLASMAVPKPSNRGADGSRGHWNDGTPIASYSDWQSGSTDQESYYAKRRMLVKFGIGGVITSSLGGVAYVAHRLLTKPNNSSAVRSESRWSSWYPNATPESPQPIALVPTGAEPIPAGLPEVVPGRDDSEQVFFNEFPRLDLYPDISLHRFYLDTHFTVWTTYWSSWEKLNLSGAFFGSIDYVQGFNPNMRSERFVYPKEYDSEKARIFGKMWDAICRDQFQYQRNDLESPLEELPASFHHPNQLSAVTYARIGLMLRLLEIPSTQENVRLLGHLISYQLLTQPSIRNYTLSAGEFASIDYTKVNFTSNGVALNEAALKVAHWAETVMEIIADKKVGVNSLSGDVAMLDNVWYFDDNPALTPQYLPTDQQTLDQLIQILEEQEGLRGGELIAEQYIDEAKQPGESRAQVAPLTPELPMRDLTEADRYWASYFGIPDKVIQTIKIRESGSVTAVDGIYQVTGDNRSSDWMNRIPAKYLEALVDRLAPLQGLTVDQVAETKQKLHNPVEQRQYNEYILQLYTPRSEGDFKVAAEIQTFIGLWFINTVCMDYGNDQDGYYLSFLLFNHTDGVLKLVEQIRQKTDASRSTAVSIGNQAIEAIHNVLYGLPPSTKVTVDPNSVIIIPKVRYEAPRNRFFWRIDLQANFEYEGRPFTLIIPSAHYLWKFVIQPQGDFVWQSGAGSNLPEAGDRSGFTAQEYAQEMLTELTDKYGNTQAQALLERLNHPEGVLTNVSTGKGIMEYYFDQ